MSVVKPSFYDKVSQVNNLKEITFAQWLYLNYLLHNQCSFLFDCFNPAVLLKDALKDC